MSKYRRSRETGCHFYSLSWWLQQKCFLERQYNPTNLRSETFRRDEYSIMLPV